MIKRIAAVTAGAIALATITAGQASANTSWVCNDLGKDHTESGAVAMFYDAVSRGYSSQSDAQSILNTILDQCPEYLGVVVSAAKKLGSSTA
jgi:hypothetical protein